MHEGKWSVKLCTGDHSHSNEIKHSQCPRATPWNLDCNIHCNNYAAHAHQGGSWTGLLYSGKKIFILMASSTALQLTSLRGLPKSS